MGGSLLFFSVLNPFRPPGPVFCGIILATRSPYTACSMLDRFFFWIRFFGRLHHYRTPDVDVDPVSLCTYVPMHSSTLGVQEIPN